MYIHKTLVASVSKPLDRLMNGNMSEAQSGEGGLEEVDGPTFARFCHWAYAGFYRAAEASNRLEDIAPASQSSMSNLLKCCTDWLTISLAGHVMVTTVNSPLPPKRVKKSVGLGGAIPPPNTKELMKELFLALQPGKSGDERTVLVSRANSAPSEDYTDVFLSHTYMYVFAEKFDIQPLKRLALRYLHQTLAGFTLWPESVGDIVVLARFVYDNTSVPLNGVEPMRDMLKRYICYEMDVLVGAADFKDLLEEDKELLHDFCSMVGERIKEIEK